ncbi:MAG: FAD-binding protein, partial [Alphaproteobacteria bacterium]
ATDCNGRTSLPGLWACGEVAATGLHGANRLASNSLLEGLVFGARAGLDIAALCAAGGGRPIAPLTFTPRFQAYDAPELTGLALQLRELMSRHAGVVRNAKGLRAALAGLEGLMAQAGNRSARLSNMLLAARLVCTAALQRRESRGGHYREDFPAADPDQESRSFVYPPNPEIEKQQSRVTA